MCEKSALSRAGHRGCVVRFLAAVAVPGLRHRRADRRRADGHGLRIDGRPGQRGQRGGDQPVHDHVGECAVPPLVVPPTDIPFFGVPTIVLGVFPIACLFNGFG